MAMKPTLNHRPSTYIQTNLNQQMPISIQFIPMTTSHHQTDIAFMSSQQQRTNGLSPESNSPQDGSQGKPVGPGSDWSTFLSL